MIIRVVQLISKLLILNCLLGCVYLQGSMEPKVHSLYDPNKVALEDVAILTVSDRSKLVAINDSDIAGDFFHGLRVNEYHLPPGFHRLIIKTVLDREHLNNVGTYETIESKEISVVLQKGKRYKLRYDLRSAYTRYCWIEDAGTGEFITGSRELVNGGILNPPYTVTRWEGSCTKKICSHSYSERRCENMGSCVMIKKNCRQALGCEATRSVSF